MMQTKLYEPRFSPQLYRLSKLNLGCGSQVVPGWINVDYSVGARFAKIPFFRALNRQLGLFELEWSDTIYLHDLTKKFPWSTGTIDVVYSSHTLEHLTKEAGRQFLRECYRVLRENGIIRIVVPDLSQVIAQYIEGRLQADDFVDSLGVLYANTKSLLKDRFAPFIQYPHRCMYDTPRLLAIMRDIGFDAISRSPFDSDISDIAAVELEDRTLNAVIVEGRKPTAV